MKSFKLASGTLDVNPNMDGWVITSDRAELNDGGRWMPNTLLRKGDTIRMDGSVWRGEEQLTSISA